jgi:hypothetical protein
MGWWVSWYFNMAQDWNCTVLSLYGPLFTQTLNWDLLHSIHSGDPKFKFYSNRCFYLWLSIFSYYHLWINGRQKTAQTHWEGTRIPVKCQEGHQVQGKSWNHLQTAREAPHDYDIKFQWRFWVNTAPSTPKVSLAPTTATGRRAVVWTEEEEESSGKSPGLYSVL